MANLGYVSTFNINGNELSLKDAALTEIVDEIIQAIGANNTNIAERINDLHNRSFDNTIKISSISESEIANIQDGLYKIQYVTVTGEGDNATETLNDSAILIQKGTIQYLYKDGIISSRTKENNTWGRWSNVNSDHPIKEFTSNTNTNQIEGTLYNEPDGYYLISWRWNENTSTWGPELLRKDGESIFTLADNNYNELFYYDNDNNVYSVINFDDLEIRNANTGNEYEKFSLLSPLPTSYKNVYDMLQNLGVIQVSETYDEETEKTIYSITLPSDIIEHPIILAIKDYERFAEDDEYQENPNYGLPESLMNLDFIKPSGDEGFFIPNWIGAVGETKIAYVFGLIPHEQYESDIYPDRKICDIGLIEVKTVSRSSNFMYQYDYTIEATEYLLLSRKKRTINYYWATTGEINVLDFRNVAWTDYDYFLKNVSYPVTSVNGQTGAVTVNVPVTSVNGQTGAVSLSIPDAQIQADWNQTTTTAKDYIKNKPTIPAAQIQADWNQTTTTAADYIKNKPTIVNELSDDYEPSDLENEYLELSAGDTYEEAFGKLHKAILDNEEVTAGALADLDERIDNLADVATSGDYDDLINLPTIPTVPTTSTTVIENDTNPVSGGAVYAKFADLIGSAPAALNTLGEIAAALNNDADLAGTLTNQISGKISKVSPATAGNFAALNSDGTLVDSGHKHSDYLTSQTQANWNETNTSSAAYINNKPTIPTVPTNISAFTNDSGYITASSIVQSDWNQSTTTASDYIKNKPDIRTGSGQTYIGENSYVKIGGNLLHSNNSSTIDVSDTLISLRSQDSDNTYSHYDITSGTHNAYFYSTYNNNQRTISKRIHTAAAIYSNNLYTVNNGNSYVTLYTDEYVDQNLNAYVGFTFQGINNNELINSYYKFEPSYFTLSTEVSNAVGTGAIRLSSYQNTDASYWMAINGERIPKLSDIQTSLSSNYATSTDTNDDLLLASGDTYEEAFGKLEKAILDNSEVAAAAIQEVASNMVTSVNGETGDVILTVPEGQLSDDYEMSTATNEDLELTSGDTYETAFGKLEKAIIDNELVVTNAITDLDARILDTESLATVAKSGSYNDLTNRPTIPSKTSDLTNDSGFLTSAPVTSVNGQQGAVTLTLGQTNVIETVKVNNTALTPDANKAVNITVPTKTSDLTNDSGFITTETKANWNETNSNSSAYIQNKPTIPSAPGTLNTTATTAQSTSSSEALSGSITLHKVSKTGNYNDLIGKIPITITNGSDYRVGESGIVKIKDRPDDALANEIWICCGEFNDEFYSEGEIHLSEYTYIGENMYSPVTESTVSGWGFTKNTGTITGITMNGASKGTSGVVDLGTVLTSQVKANWNETNSSSAAYIQNKPTIPAAVTEATVSGWGFTKNTGTLTSETDPIFSASAAANITSTDITNWNNKTSNTGTITGITMNGASKGTSGVVDLGTVLTSQTKANWNETNSSSAAYIQNKPTIPTVNDSTVTITMNGNTVGTFTLNKSGNTTIDLGTVLTSHQSIKTINNQTITGAGNVDISGLPTVTSADNGKVLMVVNGAWQLVSPVTLYSGSGTPANSQGNNGDLYVQS